MDLREQRGLVIAALCRLNKQNGRWLVPSQSGAKKPYVVDPEQRTCTCPDHEDGNKCKHLFAVEFTIKRELNPDGTFDEAELLPFPEKKTYKQNWPAYNQAQTTEKDRFQVLLHDLCRTVPPFARKPGPGRNSVPAGNAVFGAAFKVYSTVSVRRFNCDLKAAYQRGFVSQPIHYNSVCHYLEHPELTPRLKSLIAVSSSPLRAVETEFAADSTGFSSSRFSRWYDEKYGVTRTGHDWVKAHVMCGVKTNVVTAVVVEGMRAADAPQFKHLLGETARNFTIEQVSADKAYLSAENIQAVFEAGGIPFIQFKKDSTGGAGGFFEKSFHYYCLHREEFLQHYHKRSNVESTFSAIKRKFGDFVRSRSDIAMLNEVLCKILCHNICCLIHSQHELGIDPVFWEGTTNALPRKE